MKIVSMKQIWEKAPLFPFLHPFFGEREGELEIEWEKFL